MTALFQLARGGQPGEPRTHYDDTYPLMHRTSQAH